MGDVFVSYARVDAAFVRRLCRLLADQGRDAWVDWEDIPPTAEWLSEIFAAIEAADDFAFVISPDSCASETCRIEIEHARQNNKRLLPILHRNVDASDVPAPMAKLNWILFRASDDAGTAEAQLRRALETDLEWVRAHTRLLVRSTEWEKAARDASLLLRGSDLQRALGWLTQAGETTRPAPTVRQREFIRLSQKAEARELERVRGLYQRALSSQLCAQARWLEATRLGNLPLAMALCVESLRRVPSPDGEAMLRACLALQAKRVARLPHDCSVSVIAFSPQGEMLATASGQWTERENYDAESRGKSLEDFIDQDDLNEFLARGKRIVDDPRGRVAHLWEPVTGRELARIEHSGSVMAVAFSADGTRLASGSADGEAKIWDVSKGGVIHSVPLGPAPWRGSLKLGPDGKWLLAEGNDGAVQVLDLATGREASSSRRKQVLRAVRQFDRGRLDEREERLRQVLHAHRKEDLQEAASRLGIAPSSKGMKADFVGAIARELLGETFLLSPDARLLADTHRNSTDSDTVSLFDIAGRECARVAPGGFIAATAFHPSGRFLGTAAGEWVELWEVEGKETLRFLPAGNDVGTLRFDRDGSHLVAGEDKLFADIEPAAALWEVATGVRQDETTAPELAALLAAARNPWELVSSDDELVARRDEPSHTVCVRRRKSRRFEARLEHQGWVGCAQFGAKGRLATGTDLAAHVWDAEKGRELAQFPHAQQVRAVALDPTGDRLAAACDDARARVWEIESGRELLVVRHEHAVGAVAFSPDGVYLATGGDDCSARVWEIASGREVARLHHDGPVRAVAFSPDARSLATGSLEGEIALWVFRPEALVALACARMTRNLTPEEWQQYLPDEPYRATCPNLPFLGEKPGDEHSDPV